MGGPRDVVGRPRAGGGWSRSSPRPWGVAVPCATTDRSSPPAPRRTVRHLARPDGPVAVPRATTDGWPRTAHRGRGGGCPPAAAGVRHRAHLKATATAGPRTDTPHPGPDPPHTPHPPPQ